MSDFLIDTDVRANRIAPALLVTHPVDLQVSDSDADTITVTISYANADLDGVDPNDLVVVYRPTFPPFPPDPGIGFQWFLGGTIDTGTKTITSEFQPTDGSTHIFGFPSPTGISGQYALGFSAGCTGGGGGGLVRPGLVVNALAGAGALASLFGGGEGSGPANPTFGESTMSVIGSSGDQGFAGTISGVGSEENTFGTKIVAEIGEKVTVRVPLYENQGINNINKVIWYLNFAADNYDRNSIETYVEFKRGVVTIVDPYEKLEYADIEILQNTAWDLVVKGELIPKNTMAPSHFAFYSEDLDNNSGEILIPNALEVIESSVLLADEKNEFELTSDMTTGSTAGTTLTEIPIWIKSNALWWQQKQIDDSDFIAGIEYLIQKTIIQLDEDQITNSPVSQDIPSWIRDIAGFWAHDSITDDDFIQAMQWLISQGILTVQT
jgi:hypothetical protein